MIPSVPRLFLIKQLWKQLLDWADSQGVALFLLGYPISWDCAGICATAAVAGSSQVGVQMQHDVWTGCKFPGM